MNHPEKVSRDTVDRVHTAISALGFVRNDIARQLRVGRSTTVGLVVLDLHNPFFTDLARGAEDRAAEAGLTLTLGNSGEDAAREASHLDLFATQHVYGVLISPYGDVGAQLRHLRARGIPAVLVDRIGGDPSFSSVSVDNVAGGRMAVDHLLDQGRRRIAFAGGPFAIRQVVDRYAGAQAAVNDRPGASLEVIEVTALSVSAGREAGRLIVARAAADRVDAIFAANDLIAMGILQALMMRGVNVRVPDEIALIGYDDIDFASAAVVPLSSIRQPSGLIGRTAVEILLDEVLDPLLPPRHIVFRPELVVRESTL
jgi:LacI family transcriptional regulator